MNGCKSCSACYENKDFSGSERLFFHFHFLCCDLECTEEIFVLTKSLVSSDSKWSIKRTSSPMDVRVRSKAGYAA